MKIPLCFLVLAALSNAAQIAPVKLNYMNNWFVPLNFTPVLAEYTALVPLLKQHFIQCQFLPDNSQPAGQALRASFHDIASHSMTTLTGGADGSIELEVENIKNVALRPLLTFYKSIKTKGTSFADIVMLGGAVAISECGGTRIQIKIGRRDSVKPFGINGIPGSGEPFSTIKAKFSMMGISTRDMVLLSVGGHSIGAVRSDSDMSSNVANRTFATFDSTPSIFDKLIFNELVAGNRVIISDGRFVADSQTRDIMQEFATGTEAYFQEEFAGSYQRITLLGVKEETLIDFTWA